MVSRQAERVDFSRCEWPIA